MSTVNYDPEKLYDTKYAFGVLCSEFLEKFGQEAESVITRICRQMGLAMGRRLQKVMGERRSFEDAVRAFVAASEKSPSPARIIAIDTDRAVLEGSGCPFQLEGRGAAACEALMQIDQAILEGASEQKVQYKVVKSLASGDAYCEVVFEAG